MRWADEGGERPRATISPRAWRWGCGLSALLYLTVIALIVIGGWLW